MKHLEARAGCRQPCAKQVLIPLGRSLQRTSASPAFFEYPARRRRDRRRGARAGRAAPQGPALSRLPGEERPRRGDQLQRGGRPLRVPGRRATTARAVRARSSTRSGRCAPPATRTRRRSSRARCGTRPTPTRASPRRSPAPAATGTQPGRLSRHPDPPRRGRAERDRRRHRPGQPARAWQLLWREGCGNGAAGARCRARRSSPRSSTASPTSVHSTSARPRGGTSSRPRSAAPGTPAGRRVLRFRAPTSRIATRCRRKAHAPSPGSRRRTSPRRSNRSRHARRSRCGPLPDRKPRAVSSPASPSSSPTPSPGRSTGSSRRAPSANVRPSGATKRRASWRGRARARGSDASRAGDAPLRVAGRLDAAAVRVSPAARSRRSRWVARRQSSTSRWRWGASTAAPARGRSPSVPRTTRARLADGAAITGIEHGVESARGACPGCGARGLGACDLNRHRRLRAGAQRDRGARGGARRATPRSLRALSAGARDGGAIRATGSPGERVVLRGRLAAAAGRGRGARAADAGRRRRGALRSVFYRSARAAIRPRSARRRISCRRRRSASRRASSTARRASTRGSACGASGRRRATRRRCRRRCRRRAGTSTSRRRAIAGLERTASELVRAESGAAPRLETLLANGYESLRPCLPGDGRRGMTGRERIHPANRLPSAVLMP